MHKLHLYHRVNAKISLNLMMFFAFFLTVNNADAEVYKCTSIDRATQKSKIVYSDTPCDKSASQKMLDVTDPIKASNQKPAATTSEANDDDFSRALLDGDFKKAKSLAKTKEQWRMIALAGDKSGEDKPADKSPVQSTLETSNQQLIAQNMSRNEACEQARNDFDVTSRNQWRERDLVAAKKSIMLAACGTAEVPSQPYVVNATYNGIRSYTTPIYPYGYGWGPHYPYGTHHGYGQDGIDNGGGYAEHSGSGQTSGGSVSLRYNSKNFGVNAESFGIKSHTFGTQTIITEPH